MHQIFGNVVFPSELLLFGGPAGGFPAALGLLFQLVRLIFV